MNFFVDFVYSVDICLSSPCQNNGSCVANGSAGYIGTCRTGYLGPRCESKTYMTSISR